MGMRHRQRWGKALLSVFLFLVLYFVVLLVYVAPNYFVREYFLSFVLFCLFYSDMRIIKPGRIGNNWFRVDTFSFRYKA